MNIQVQQYNTFRRHSRWYLEPAIYHKWNVDQNLHLEDLKKKGKVALSGDMRADSPGKKKKCIMHPLYFLYCIKFLLFLFCLGHSAKFGTYTLMNVESEKIVDLQLVQV